MIPAGLLYRLRLRARCYAMRVRWVDELEQQRDDARGRARAAEVERDQARAEAKRANDMAGRLDEVIAATQRALRHAGYRVRDESTLRADVLEALGDRFTPPREAYDPAMGGDIEPPPGREGVPT